MTDPEYYWNYRIWRIALDDGYVYGMKETHYHKGRIEYWSAEPYWTEQDPNDFLPTIDRYEKEIRAGEFPEWAIGYTVDDCVAALANMRQACTLKVIDERQIEMEFGE